MLPNALTAVFRPWTDGRLARCLAHVALDVPMGIVMFTVTFPLAVTTVSLLIVLPAAMAVSWCWFVAAHLLAGVERDRFAALLGVHLIDAHPTLAGTTAWQRYRERIGSAARWKEVGYALVRYPLTAVTAAVGLGVWSAGIVGVLAPLVASRRSPDALAIGGYDIGGAGIAAVAVTGVVLLVIVAPWVTVGIAQLDLMVARALLGRTERAEFEQRVTTLETQRDRAVDSAEAERRRIERDLHDGAQQRLIAVAMHLGVARQRLDDDPETARALVGEAHDEVKSALKELRDLVRGIHPVILEDRGLDAALSAVVARSTVPVDLRVDVERRPPPAVESAAYFIVSEALVNVARHSGADAATVEIHRHGDRLTISVSDDGHGGADPTRGSGLSGLGDRVAGLGGWMQVVSPEGGPTTLMVEVPCGS